MPRLESKTSPRMIDRRYREAEAMRLRRMGLDYATIAAQVGYANKAAAHHAVARVLARLPVEDADEVRRIEGERLDWLWSRAVRDVLADHLAFSAGKVVTDASGSPLIDAMPRLKAIEACVRIMERRARMLGLDAPQQKRVEVLTLDVIEAEIRRLEGEMDDLDIAAAALPVPPARKALGQLRRGDDEVPG